VGKDGFSIIIVVHDSSFSGQKGIFPFEWHILIFADTNFFQSITISWVFNVLLGSH
jgi:hypothetical protein